MKENRFCCGGCEKSRKTNTPPNAANGPAQKKTRAFAQTRAKPPSTESKFSNDDFLGFNANEVVESSTSDDEADAPTQSLPRNSRSDNRSSIDDDASIVDARAWSTDQVFKYFKSKFPRQAHVFKEHEIDGSSLYLLKRGDVVKGFNIKLGPALKIHRHICELQTNKKDRTLTWH